MWIPRYIDMNPHFSQNILKKAILECGYIALKTCVHIAWIIVLLVFNVFYSQLTVYRDISTFASHGIKYVNVSTLQSL